MCMQPHGEGARGFRREGTMNRIKAIVLSVAVLFALSGFALARDDDHDNNKNNGKNGYQQGYSRGYQEGQRAARDDRDHHRDSNRGKVDDDRGYSKSDGSHGQYKKGYREGYRKGYDESYNSRGGAWGNHDRDRDHDRNGDHDRDGNWQHGQNTGGWNNNNDVAYRTGYQDGLNEGRKDRSGGHSFRPHSHDETYGNADHNYSTVGGDRNAYKQRYRQAFDQGYNKGYNGR